MIDKKIALSYKIIDEETAIDDLIDLIKQCLDKEIDYIYFDDDEEQLYKYHIFYSVRNLMEHFSYSNPEYTLLDVAFDSNLLFKFE